MTRHRVRKSSLRLPLSAATALAATAVMLILYVWLNARLHTLGVRINRLEQRQTEVGKQRDLALWQWQKMKQPAQVEAALTRHGIVMTWPDDKCIVRLTSAVRADERTVRRPQRPNVIRLSQVSGERHP